MRKCIIYALMDPRNGQVRYVGKTHVSLSRRVSHHIWGALNGDKTHCRSWIRNVLDDGFHIIPIVLERLNSDEDWCAKEAKWISSYKETSLDGLTNHTDGGEGVPGLFVKSSTRALISKAMKGRQTWSKGKKLPLETRKRMSEAHKGINTWMVGKKPTDDTRARISSALSGKPKSLEHNRKVSAALKGRKISPEHCSKLKGRVFSQESRKRMSDAKKGNIPWNKGIKGYTIVRQSRAKPVGTREGVTAIP